MPNIGPMEIAIVLIIALIVLGPKRLPDAGKSLGKGLRGFKDSMSGMLDSDSDADSLSVEEKQPAKELPQERLVGPQA